MKAQVISRYLLKRKSDGRFYRPSGWTDDPNKAKTYSQKGHPRLVIYTYIPYRKPDQSGYYSREERSQMRRDRFDEHYEVVKVDLIMEIK